MTYIIIAILHGNICYNSPSWWQAFKMTGPVFDKLDFVDSYSESLNFLAH